jgi:predicted alpha/beta superfamily hydrolase
MIKKWRVKFPAQKGYDRRWAYVYLPTEARRDPKRRFPVLYMFDGHNVFFDEDATYGKSWGLKEFLEGWGKEIIIVGLECSHEGNQRLQEYCPYTFRGKFWGGTLKGTGKETLQWMVSELKPMIDREYRTWSHREATGIGGSSMGGLMALYAVTAYNDVFSKAACVSPSIGLVERRGGPVFDTILSGSVDPDTQVYLSWGEKEDLHGFLSRDVRRAEELLRQKGAGTFLLCQPDGSHCEADWERQVPVFMDHLW